MREPPNFRERRQREVSRIPLPKLFGNSEWVPDQVAEGLQKHP